MYDAYVATYVEHASRLPCVEAIYASTAHGLSIYTVYTGGLFAVGPQLMKAKGEAMDASPYMPVDFQFIPAHVEMDLPNANTHQVFPVNDARAPLKNYRFNLVAESTDTPDGFRYIDVHISAESYEDAIAEAARQAQRTLGVSLMQLDDGPYVPIMFEHPEDVSTPVVQCMDRTEGTA